MLTKIGFFHFGDERNGDPVGSLEENLKLELEDAAIAGQTLDDCLIVVPEAFNVKNYNGEACLNRSIRDSLIRVSIELGIAFVAGLIEETETDVLGDGYSSAYLIDGATPCQLLSRKTRRDSTTNYRPYPGNCDEPIVYRGLCIAALICMDACSDPADARTLAKVDDAKKQAAQIKKRHENLIEQIRKRSEGAPTILCVPARMNTLSSTAVAEYWRGLASHITVVVANAGSSHPSVIRLQNNEILCPDNNHAAGVKIRSLF